MSACAGKEFYDEPTTIRVLALTHVQTLMYRNQDRLSCKRTRQVKLMLCANSEERPRLCSDMIIIEKQLF